MNNARARLKDIALRTGFSINTVSVALRGGERIPLSTRELIMQAARDLNYFPNTIARSLVSGKTRTAGVVLNNILNPILTLYAQAAERELAQHGYGTVLAFTSNSVTKEKEALRSLQERQVDGILIYPADHGDMAHIAGLRQMGHPVVLLSRAQSAELDVVAVNERRGAFEAMKHLLELGHRRIAFIDGGRSVGNTEKLTGYEQALQAAGQALDPSLLVHPDGGNSALHGYQAMARVAALRPAPTAVFASADLLAIGALHWCRENGLSVPSDIAVVGFDNIEISAFLDVPLTTVAYPAADLSRTAVRRLMSLITADQGFPQAQTDMIEPELIIRESSARREATPKRKRNQGGLQ